MSELREQFVTIDVINRGVKVKKFEGGGTYEATVIEGTTSEGQEFKKNLASTLLEKMPTLAEQVESLDTGDLVKIVSQKKGKYNNIRSIYKEGDPLFNVTQATVTNISSGGSNTGSKGGYNPEGQIKGNAITNAVQLAIAQKTLTKEAIVANAMMLLEVHKEIEGVQLASVGQDTSEGIDANDPVKAAEMF